MRSPAVALVTLAAFFLLVLPPRIARADGEELAAAKQHFEAGRAAYLSRDYGQAISEFQAAQTLRPSPILDYNIGLSYEALGDGPNAYSAYQRYLAAKPDAPNRAEVEQRLNSLSQQALQAQQPDPQPAAAPAPPPPQYKPNGDPYAQGYYHQQPPPPPPPAPAPKKKGSLWWIVFPIVGGVALTALIVWAAVNATPSYSYGYERAPLSLEPGNPRETVPTTLPGEVLRF